MSERSHNLPQLRSFAYRAVAFVLVFAALQTCWELARGSRIETLWVNDITVRTASALINLITPGVEANARGARIVAAGGGLNVKFGCEGTDVMFLLCAAFVVFRSTARARIRGLLLGLVLVFVLNQVRIAGLFYAFRLDKSIFNLMHASGAPLIMATLTGVYFFIWSRRAESAARLEGAPTPGVPL